MALPDDAGAEERFTSALARRGVHREPDPQELRIAQLAASGLSNRDIAARSYLGVRTAADFDLRPRLVSAISRRIRFANGTTATVDAVLWATGYRSGHGRSTFKSPTRCARRSGRENGRPAR